MTEDPKKSDDGSVWEQSVLKEAHNEILKFKTWYDQHPIRIHNKETKGIGKLPWEVLEVWLVENKPQVEKFCKLLTVFYDGD